MAETHTAEQVWYNGGAGREHEYALVVKDHGGTKLDLLVLTESGVTVENEVPRREPADYGPEGGGRTWHSG